MSKIAFLLMVLCGAPSTAWAQSSPLNIWSEDFLSGKKLRVQNTSNTTVRLVSYVIDQCVNVAQQAVTCDSHDDGSVLPPGAITDLAYTVEADDSSKPYNFHYAILRWEAVSAPRTRDHFNPPAAPSIPKGQKRCGNGTIPDGAGCCDDEGHYCPQGTYCDWDIQNGRPTSQPWNGLCIDVDGNNTPPASAVNIGDDARDLTKVPDDRARRRQPGPEEVKKRQQRERAAEEARRQAEVAKQKAEETAQQEAAQREAAAERLQSDSEAQAERREDERERAAEELRRRAEEARRQEQERRDALAEEATQRADHWAAQSQRDLSELNGHATGDALQSQLAHIEAAADSQGNYSASAAIQQSEATSAEGQAMGDAVGGLVGALVNAWSAHQDAEDRAEEARQERIRRQHDQARQTLAEWKSLKGIEDQLRSDSDFGSFGRSPEYSSCPGLPNADGLLSALSQDGDNDASLRQQASALEASDSAESALKCQIDSFKAYEQRISALCAQLRGLYPEDLSARRSSSPDIPPRCFDAARQAYFSSLRAEMKSVGGASSSALGLNRLDGDSPPNPAGEGAPSLQPKRIDGVSSEPQSGPSPNSAVDPLTLKRL